MVSTVVGDDSNNSKIVLEKGKIVQAGRHEDLMLMDGLYKDMYGEELTVQALI